MGVWGRLECGPGDGVGLGVQRENGEEGGDVVDGIGEEWKAKI